MRFFAIAVPLLFPAFAAAAEPAVAASSPTAPAVRDLTPREALELIESRRKDGGLVVLDVRTPEEFNDGHIAGAVNLDSNDREFRAKLAKLDPSKTYLVHCFSGARSRRAVKRLRDLGFADLYHMPAGMKAWKKEKLPLGE